MIGRSGCFPEAPTFFQRAGLCREKQLLLRFFDEGSRRLEPMWASLTFQGVECVDPTFSRSRIKRRGQRENVAISNRLPRFRIRACFERFLRLEHATVSTLKGTIPLDRLLFQSLPLQQRITFIALCSFYTFNSIV